MNTSAAAAATASAATAAAAAAAEPEIVPAADDELLAPEELASAAPIVELSRTVLLAVDLTDRSERMIEWYSNFAAYFSDRVVMGYIIEPPSMLVGHFTPLSTKEPDYYTIEGGQDRARQLGEKLKQYAESIGLRNVEFRGEFYGCSAPVGLLRLAEEIKASVVVVSSRGLSKMKRVILGSTTDHILRHSLRPVLVVPPTFPGTMA